jgi:O-6-methylguanine DNA methyltransferase
MNDINDPAPARDVEGPEPARHSFRKLLATNPNYFGTFPDLPFDAVEPKSLDTAYEELECVSYSPARDRLEATVLVKRPFGYGGGPCTDGSFEHVRFYIDYGSGWEDAGVAAINVHDLPVGEDCRGRSTHPLSYVCGVPHTPRRQWCANPVLPRIRAILSWNFEPPAGQPDWDPPWGNVHDCRAQINPRRFVIADIAHQLPDEILSVVPQIVLEQPPSPDPDPGPLQAMSLDVLAKSYRRAQVPVHRFAFPTLQAASEPGADVVALSASAAAAKAADIDLADVFKAVEDTSGDTTFEELECLGLDNGLQSLVATFRKKVMNARLRKEEANAFIADYISGLAGYTYLEGDLAHPDLPYDLSMVRSEFRREVLETLARDVGPGQVVTYGGLAARVGHPKAARAAGTACATNPVPLVVPCHRVLPGGGGVGNYGGGAHIKRTLLELEGSMPRGS